VLIPARAVLEVARLAGGEEQVRIDIASSQAGFHIGDVIIQSRLIEGEFPAYRQLLPEDLPARLTVSKGPFLEALKRVAVLAQDATPVFLELGAEAIKLSCHAQGLGEADEEVEGNYTGEEMRVAFNAGYLEAGMTATESEEVEIEFTDSQRPALVHAPGDRMFQYLLMPIRVS
jgi:DNA polymerase-3 subunit beta